MKLPEINKILLEALKRDEHEAAQLFFDYSSKIDQLCSDEKAIYSRLDLPNSVKNFNSEFIDKVYISSLFTDVTRIYTNSTFGTYRNTEDYNKLEIEELLEFHGIIDSNSGEKQIINISEGFFTFTDEEGEFLENNLNPLFETGIITLCPNPNLMIIAGSQENPNFYTVPSERDYTKQIWRAPLILNKQIDIPVKEAIRNNKQSEIIDSILIPYLSGLPASEYAKVLQDESDLISSFRKEIKNLTELSLTEGNEAIEIYQDNIRPKIDKINYKFNSIVNIHKFKVMGVMAFSASLSLLSLSAGDYASAASIIIGVGSGSAGLIKFESEYQTEVANLRNDPMFLLWKLKQAKSKNRTI